jgi:uncharacterized protein YndB with AHSA1/START domain
MSDPRTETADVWIDIDAAPDDIWRALTTEGGLAAWMGEGASIEPHPGGAVILPDPVGGATRRGRVDRVEDGRRLDLTWWPALRPADRSTVSITVTPGESADGSPGPTRVRVVERSEVGRTASAMASVSAGSVPRRGGARLPVGLWAWRLAVLSVCGCPSRV